MTQDIINYYSHVSENKKARHKPGVAPGISQVVALSSALKLPVDAIHMA